MADSPVGLGLNPSIIGSTQPGPMASLDPLAAARTMSDIATQSVARQQSLLRYG